MKKTSLFLTLGIALAASLHAQTPTVHLGTNGALTAEGWTAAQILASNNVPTNGCPLTTFSGLLPWTNLSGVPSFDTNGAAAAVSAALNATIINSSNALAAQSGTNATNITKLSNNLANFTPLAGVWYRSDFGANGGAVPAMSDWWSADGTNFGVVGNTLSSYLPTNGEGVRDTTHLWTNGRMWQAFTAGNFGYTNEFHIVSSGDLVHWSNDTVITMPYAASNNLTWSPVIFPDPVSGNIYIYVTGAGYDNYVGQFTLASNGVASLVGSWTVMQGIGNIGSYSYGAGGPLTYLNMWPIYTNGTYWMMNVEGDTGEFITSTNPTGPWTQYAGVTNGMGLTNFESSQIIQLPNGHWRFSGLTTQTNTAFNIPQYVECFGDSDGTNFPNLFWSHVQSFNSIGSYGLNGGFVSYETNPALIQLITAAGAESQTPNQSMPVNMLASNNTAPNQTLSAGLSSLLTEALGNSLYLNSAVQSSGATNGRMGGSSIGSATNFTLPFFGGVATNILSGGIGYVTSCISDTNGNATITFSTNHPFATGMWLDVNGATNNEYGGYIKVTNSTSNSVSFGITYSGHTNDTDALTVGNQWVTIANWNGSVMNALLPLYCQTGGANEDILLSLVGAYGQAHASLLNAGGDGWIDQCRFSANAGIHRIEVHFRSANTTFSVASAVYISLTTDTAPSITWSTNSAGPAGTGGGSVSTLRVDHPPMETEFCPITVPAISAGASGYVNFPMASLPSIPFTAVQQFQLQPSIGTTFQSPLPTGVIFTGARVAWWGSIEYDFYNATGSTSTATNVTVSTSLFWPSTSY